MSAGWAVKASAHVLKGVSTFLISEHHCERLLVTAVFIASRGDGRIVTVSAQRHQRLSDIIESCTRCCQLCERLRKKRAVCRFETVKGTIVGCFQAGTVAQPSQVIDVSDIDRLKDALLFDRLL